MRGAPSDCLILFLLLLLVVQLLLLLLRLSVWLTVLSLSQQGLLLHLPGVVVRRPVQPAQVLRGDLQDEDLPADGVRRGGGRIQNREWTLVDKNLTLVLFVHARKVSIAIKIILHNSIKKGSLDTEFSMEYYTRTSLNVGQGDFPKCTALPELPELQLRLPR